MNKLFYLFLFYLFREYFFSVKISNNEYTRKKKRKNFDFIEYLSLIMNALNNFIICKFFHILYFY